MLKTCQFNKGHDYNTASNQHRIHWFVFLDIQVAQQERVTLTRTNSPHMRSRSKRFGCGEIGEDNGPGELDDLLLVRGKAVGVCAVGQR